MALCPLPSGIAPCPPTLSYSMGGTDYFLIQLCDSGNNQLVLAVYQLCDGVSAGAPTYYDLLGAVYTPVGTVGKCADAVDYEVVCDKGTNPDTRIIAVWDGSVVPPRMNYFTMGITGALTPYTPVGPVAACPEMDVEESQICYLAINAGVGYAAGDQLLQILFWNTGETPPTLIATIWRNQTTSAVLAAAPPNADLTSCGGQQPQSIVFCDEYPTPCEVGNLLVDANWATSGSITDAGSNAFIFSDADRPINGVVTQTVNVTVGSSYTFAATISRQGLGAGNTQALIQVHDGATLLAGGTFANGTNANFPGLISAGGTLKVTVTDTTTGTTVDSDVIVSNMSLTCVTPVDKLITTQFIRQTCATCGTGTTPTIQDFELDGVTPYTVQGTVKVCGTNSGETNVVADCSAVSRTVISYGSNLLTNGDFSQSTGTGATSDPAVGFATAYVAANNIYAAGAGTYAFFDTNAGAVTGGSPTATGVLALTGRSMAVNVGPNIAQPIVSWSNIFLENGKDYSLDVDAAVLNFPFSIGIQIDGVQVTTVDAPAAAGVWTRTQGVFTWTGPTGYHTVSVNSGSAIAGGNDHAFDNITFRKAFNSSAETLTPQPYSDVVKAVVDQIVKITGCNDDRRDTILAEIASLLSDQNPSQIDVVCACDDRDADGIFERSFRRIVSISPTGVVTVLANYDQDLLTPYTPINPGTCDVPGDNLIAARPRYKVLSGVSTWTLGADSNYPTSSVNVTSITVGNTATPPTVTDIGGTYSLFQGQSVSWSTQFSRDVAGLRPPLVFTSGVGDTLAISWMEEVV